PNDILLGFWVTVADRLFKIRNCMNIEGVVRKLPLFEPPIDPALLVRAAAAGLDLDSVLNDQYGASPHYRFTVMLQKANELCAELKALGSALLSAWEKRDGEALSQLRSSQELAMLAAVREVKKSQVKDAEKTLDALMTSLELAEIKYNHYSNLE